MTRAAYDDIADWYESEFLAHQRRGGEAREFADSIGIDRALVDLLGPGTGTCLEVGCGTGVYAERVRALGRQAIGVDISGRMLRYAAERLPTAQGDATRLPFGSGAVDAVIGVMIHSDMPAFGEVVDEIGRVLRPGGVFVHVGVHPCFIGAFADRSEPTRSVIRPGYLDERWTPAVGPTRGGVGVSGQVRHRVGAAHYTLATLLNTIARAGLQFVEAAEGGAPTPTTFSVRALKPASG
ncbi:MAG: class I SAM-dependent methyltransferase [Actinomycetota bacterium]